MDLCLIFPHLLGIIYTYSLTQLDFCIKQEVIHMTTQYLNIHQAAAQLGKSTKTVRKYIKDGKLAHVKENTVYGSQYLIPLEAVESLLNIAGPAETGMEVLPEGKSVSSIVEPLQAIESLLLGMEASRQEYDKSRDDKLLQAIERLEARVEEMSRPWYRRLWKK
jgi:excisionase family DNA binding protein